MFYSLGVNAPLITAAAITVRLMAARWGSQTDDDPPTRAQPGTGSGIWSLSYKVSMVFKELVPGKASVWSRDPLWARFTSAEGVSAAELQVAKHTSAHFQVIFPD